MKMKKKERKKKQPQVFTQGTSVSNFSQMQPFLSYVGCSKVFG